MRASEMIRRLRVALEDEEQPYKYSTERLFLWLQGAYVDRQLQSSQWSFLHQRGSFIVTAPGTADYSIQQVKDIDPNSIYYIGAGSDAKLPITIKDYSLWVSEQADGVEYTPSVPMFLIELPDHRWKVEPTPDAVYRIYADRWHRPSEFANVDSEPLWEAEYHEIVLLDAMKIAAAMRPDRPETLVMLQTVKERLPAMERAFRARYLPSIGRAGPHL